MSAELQQSRNSCSGRRAELHEGCFGKGPCCDTEKACMPGYISRGFAAIVMNLPRPLASRKEAQASESYTMGIYPIHTIIYILLVCYHSRNLPVFIFDAHIWQGRCSDRH